MSLLVSIIGGIMTLVVMIALSPKKGSREARLINTPDTKILDLESISVLHTLGPAPFFVVRTFRQSGNLQQPDRVFEDSATAVKAAVSTFRRSKISAVVVMINTADEFAFRRPWRDHRGSTEGKKVGWVEVHRVPESRVTRASLPSVAHGTAAEAAPRPDASSMFSHRTRQSMPLGPRAAQAQLAPRAESRNPRTCLLLEGCPWR